MNFILNILKFKIKHQRSQKQLNNIVSSILFKGLGLFFTFLTVPITLNLLNVSEYGIWVTLTSFVGWIALIDGGLGNGLKNKLSESIANNNLLLAKGYTSTAYFGVAFIVLIFIISFLLLNIWVDLPSLIRAPSNLYHDIYISIWILVISFCLRLITDLLSSMLSAIQRFGLVNIIYALNNLIVLIGTVFISKFINHNELIYLSLLYSVLPVLIYLILSWFYFRNDLKDIAPSINYFDIKCLKNISSLSVKFFLIQIAVVIIFSTDNIIIIRLFSSSDVTIYNIAYKYFSLFTLFWTLILTPYWVAFNEAYVKNDFQWIKNTVKNLLKIWLVFVIVVLIGVLISDKVYSIWVGSEIHVPVTLSILMGCFVLISSFSNIFVYFINGTGKIQVQFYGAIIAGIINIPLAYLFAKTFALGLNGIILSTCISLASGPILSFIQYNKIINNTSKGVWNK